MTENTKKNLQDILFKILPWIVTGVVTIFAMAKASALGMAQQAAVEAVVRVEKAELCIKELQNICAKVQVSLGIIDTKLDGIDKRLKRIEDKP